MLNNKSLMLWVTCFCISCSLCQTDCTHYSVSFNYALSNDPVPELGRINVYMKEEELERVKLGNLLHLNKLTDDAFKELYRKVLYRHVITDASVSGESIQAKVITTEANHLTYAEDIQLVEAMPSHEIYHMTMRLLGTRSQVLCSARGLTPYTGPSPDAEYEAGYYSFTELREMCGTTGFVLTPDQPALIDRVKINTHSWLHGSLRLDTEEVNNLQRALKYAEAIVEATGDYTVPEALVFLLSWWNFDAVRSRACARVSRLGRNTYELIHYRILPEGTMVQDRLAYKTVGFRFNPVNEDDTWHKRHFENPATFRTNTPTQLESVMRKIPESTFSSVKVGIKEALVPGIEFNRANMQAFITHLGVVVSQISSRMEEDIAKTNTVLGFYIHTNIEVLYEALDLDSIVRRWLEA